MSRNLAGDQPSGDVSLVLNAGGAETVMVPDAVALIESTFVRSGPDLLIITPDGSEVLVAGYFASATPPALATADGASLAADLVTTLADTVTPQQVAQLGPSSEPPPIGRVETAAGDVNILRADGTTERFGEGSWLYEGDVIVTGVDAAVGLVFADASTFTLGGNGRMVLDKFSYDPASHEGAVTFSVLQGTFAFVGGEIDSGVTIRTPVATLDIRGSALVDQSTQAGVYNTITLLPDERGIAGQVAVTNDAGSVVLDGAYETTLVASLFDAPLSAITLAPQQIAQITDALAPDALSGLPDFSALDLLVEITGPASPAGDTASTTPTEGEPPLDPAIGAAVGLGPEIIIASLSPAALAALASILAPPPPALTLTDLSTTLFNTQESISATTVDLPPSEVVVVSVIADTGLPSIGGTAGNDVLSGTPIAEAISGLAGDDILSGSGGDDILDGGAGNDTVDFSAAAGTGVAVDLSITGVQTISASEGNDTLKDIENVIGSPLGDTLTGDVAANSLDGGAGADTISGAGGADSLVGGTGADTLDGGAGNDDLSGGDDADILIGGADNDTLDGGAAADTLVPAPTRSTAAQAMTTSAAAMTPTY
jgi:hypothetical protein